MNYRENESVSLKRVHNGWVLDKKSNTYRLEQTIHTTLEKALATIAMHYDDKLEINMKYEVTIEEVSQ